MKLNVSTNPAKKTPLLAASIMVSVLSGCGNLDTMPGFSASSPEAVESAAVEKVSGNGLENTAMQVSEEQSAQEVERQTAQAEAMMASLKAPLKEPGADVEKAIGQQAVETKEQVAEAVTAVEEKAEAEVDEKKMAVEKASEQIIQAKADLGESAVKNAQVAAEEIPTKAIAPTLAKPFNVSMKDLPFNYDIWWINKGDTALTQGLVISTPTWEMGKEGYVSQIWLTLKEDEIHINSSSDIATDAKGLGIRIDGGELIPFTRIAENNIGVIEGKWLDKLANSMVLDIYLGFFPDKKPLSDTFQSNTALGNLDRVVATYRELLK